MSALACARCGHDRDSHQTLPRRSPCGARHGNRTCPCLHFVGAAELDDERELATLEPDWTETALWAVLDLLLHEKNGEVHIPTDGGRDCKIAVRFEDQVGYLVKGGRA